ncbi:MAG: hypothetical protein H0V82_00980 [Candidatus Protochlamydia sp.]|nr:hypothetical protein [Candidatus Protochlamydia sp.]
MFNADRFTINTIVPLIQTTAVAIGTYATGKFLNHSVTIQTAALMSAVASIVAAVADKFFDKSTQAAYATNLLISSGLGVGAGILAHSFIYPTLPINFKAAGAFFIGLIAVRGVVDFMNSRRTPTVTVNVTA